MIFILLAAQGELFFSGPSSCFHCVGWVELTLGFAVVSLWSFGGLKEKGKIIAIRACIFSQLTGMKWQMNLSVGLEMVK